MILGDTDGRVLNAGGGRLSREGEFSCVEDASRPHFITPRRAHATLIILILVRTFRAHPLIRRHLSHHGRLSKLLLVAMIPSGELREAEDLIRREQLFVHLRICTFVWPMLPIKPHKKTNTQKTPSNGNRSTVIFCTFVYSYSG